MSNHFHPLVRPEAGQSISRNSPPKTIRPPDSPPRPDRLVHAGLAGHQGRQDFGEGPWGRLQAGRPSAMSLGISRLGR
jgi:hypothetical protein